MPDIAAIGAILTSLKTATEISKALRDSDFSMEKAELKLKIADLTIALADLKIEVIDVQESIEKKDARILELENAFQAKDEVVRHFDAYYRKDEKDRAVGRPMCIRCWDVDHKLFELHISPKDRFVRVCNFCKTGFNNMRTQELQRGWYEKTPT